MSAKDKTFQSGRKKSFLANDSNDSVYKNINLNRHRHHHRHSSDNDFVRSKSISNKTFDKGYNSFDAQPSSSSPIWKKNGNSNLSEYLNVWDSAKNEKEKKKSNEGVLSKTTLNLSREIEIYEQSVEDAENDSGVGKKVEEKALPPVEEPEIFPRQFENGVPETQIQQFTGSAKLFNPYTFGGPNAYALSPFISADGVHTFLPKKSQFFISKRAAPSDDFDFSVALNGNSQTPTPQPKSKKLKLKAASSLEQETLVHLIEKADTERKTLPVPERRFISMEDLISSERIRTASAENVEALFAKMEEGAFDFNSTTFIVLKPSSSSKYIILDGNARYKAQQKYNENHALTQIKTVDCAIYTDLTFDQMVIVTSPTYNSSTSFDHSILQTTKIVAKIMERHAIDAPATKNEAEFTQLMQCFLTNKYPVVINQIIKLDPDIMQQLFVLKCDNDVPLDQFKLSGVFWKTFLSAVKKNSAKSLELLSTLGESTKEEVEKALKKIEPNLLDYLREKSSHTFESEADAINKLTGGKEMSTADFIQLLGEVGFNHNRTRSAKKFSWTGLTADIIEHLGEKEASKSLEFLSTIDDGSLAQQNIIIAQNPSITVLQQLKKYHKQAVLFLMGAFNSTTPEIPNVKPTAIVDVIIQSPVLIDKICNYLPPSLVKTAVYIPGAPQGGEEARNRFLTKLAKEKRCSLAAAMNLYECDSWFKLVDNFDKALIYQCSYDVTKLMINQLSMFKSVTVVGGENLKDLIKTRTEQPQSNEAGQQANEEDNIADA